MLTKKNRKPKIKVVSDEKFHRTNGDYVLFTVAMIVFLYSMFIYQNMQIYLSSIICVYEIIQITILPGKTRLRFIPMTFYVMVFIMQVKNKMCEGIDEYRRWRNR